MEITQLIWIIAVTVLTLLNIVWQFDLQTRQRRLRERYDRLFGGAEGADRQIGLEALTDQIEGVQGQIGRVETLARQIQSTLAHSIQGVGMVRFRAFQDTGGDQSFALALVDGSGNGVVLSALYAREGTRVYGKPLAAWTSVYNLTGEEKQALEQARRMVEGG
ncbi:MAG TPA: DUF4446 family protein [Anaerolineales bacterium]|nr:DUF4446 family protein [Anaerolineae bacterium]HIQ02157.1 DUF4446 family protein [Anaerolineales bacterium]